MSRSRRFVIIVLSPNALKIIHDIPSLKFNVKQFMEIGDIYNGNMICNEDLTVKEMGTWEGQSWVTGGFRYVCLKEVEYAGALYLVVYLLKLCLFMFSLAYPGSARVLILMIYSYHK